MYIYIYLLIYILIYIYMYVYIYIYISFLNTQIYNSCKITIFAQFLFFAMTQRDVRMQCNYS